MLNVFCALQIPSPRSCQPNGANTEALQYEIKELKQKDLALDQEIAQLLSEYVLGKLTVHCDASIIFVLLKQSMVQELQLKADLLCHFYHGAIQRWLQGCFELCDLLKDKREFFPVYLVKQNKFY